jgi:hypothetical protein
MNSLQVRLIHDVLGAAEAEDLPLWLESGWAIDARKLVQSDDFQHRQPG